MIDIEEKEPKVFDEEPKEITIEDAKNYFNAKYLDNDEIYDTGLGNKLKAAGTAFAGSIKKLPSQFRMAFGQTEYAQGVDIKARELYREKLFPKGNMIFNGNLGVKLGDKLLESGKYNIMTANRNLETLNREIEADMPHLSEEDRNSWTMMIAEQGLDYGVMLGLSYINPALGMGYMGAKIFGQETEEGAEAYKKKFGTIEGFEELSGDELLLNIGNVAVQEVFERAFGAPAQLKRFKTMKDFGKAFLTGFGEEFLTENLQNVSDAVFDHIGKRLEEDETIMSRIQDNFKGTLVAGLFGGTAGTAFAISNRAKGINEFEQLLEGSDVPVEERNAVATGLYESGANNLQQIITKELELNSQLRAKHGEVYETLKTQIDKQARAVGAYEGKSESEVAQYLGSTAKEQADHVLAEAQLRNTLIDDVMNSTDVVFENGRLYLKGLTEEQKKVKERKRKKKSREEVKPQEEELKTQIETNATAEEKEQNLNDVVSSYDGAENFDVESMSTDEKQAVFEAEQQVKDAFVPTDQELTHDEIARKLRFEELTEEQEGELLERLDEENERLKPLFDTARDVAFEIEEEFGEKERFGLSLGDIADSISENRLNFQDAKKMLGDFFPEGDLRTLGEIIKERDNIQGDPVKIGYDYYTERVYKSYDEKIAKEQNLVLDLPERMPTEDVSYTLMPSGLVDKVVTRDSKGLSAIYGYAVGNAEHTFLTKEEYEKETGRKYEDLAKPITESQSEISPETNEAIQEETLPEVEKEDTATSDKIEDFGEYLYGARKDLWQGFKNKLNESLPDDAEDIKLSVVFPEPNYEKAIASGVDVNALATIKALRDMIPTKPKYAYKLERWKDLVMKVRAIASQIVNNNFDMTATNEMLKSPEFTKINNAVKLYQMLGYPYFTKAKGYTLENTYYHKDYGDSWVMTNIYHEGDKVGYKIEKDGRYVRVNNSYFFENINDGIDEIKARINLDKATQGRDKKVKFDLYYKVGERNKIILGKKIRSGKYLDMHTFDSVKEAREYLTNNYDSLVAELEKLKQNPMDRGEVNRARIGDDYRNGTDVTPDMFADMFGFRGVQFGNWVEQKKRTSDLNEAYDALIDLSKVLNVPTRALSLNGTLGLAFGARGHSGALAHYEPDSVVINLTKMKGAGSLGHEWFHALDNSFMKKDNKWGSFATEEAMTENPLSHNRPEVMLAFFELRKALQESKIFERSAEWDKAKKDDYWSSIRELGARTFEQYAKDKLAERGVTNDFLVNILAPEDNQSVYLLQDEKTPIYAAYDKLFNTLKTRETEKGVEFYQSAFAGSRVDYDRPSLEAIGSGEGGQAHGWGLYYALNRDVAESYRESFIGQKVSYQGSSFGSHIYYRNPIEYAAVESLIDAKKDKTKAIKHQEELLQKVSDKSSEYYDEDIAKEHLAIIEEIKKINVNDIGITESKGQVHEVDIPENPYLLDEQKPFSEQSEIVKQGITDAVKEIAGENAQKQLDILKEKDYLGREIYNTISRFLSEDENHQTNTASEKAASQLLEKHGIKGITYDGRQDGRCFVIFNPADVKVIQKFYQRKKGKIKGAFDSLTKSIRITKNADFSTYQHEFAHFWLDNIWDYVNSGKASEEYVKRFEELKKWLGVEPGQGYFSNEQHEKFARGYEKFLYQGKAVNPIIASAFDDYEKFIRDVYDDITEIDTRADEKYEPLTREAYNFFNSMVSGELTPPANLPDETIEQARQTVEKSETDAEEVVAEETKVLEENRANYKLEPVKTDTKTSYLSAYEKMTGEQVEAGVAELDKEMAKANEFVANNLELAEKIVNGEAPTPENMLKNTIYLAYQDMQKKLGNTDKRVNALLNQAQELRAYGQEIASQKLAYADQSTPLYWLSRVMSARAESIAEGNKMTASELQDYINKEIRPAIGDEKAVENVVKTLAENLGIRELYQTEKVDFSTKDGVYKYVTSKLGITPTQEQTAEIVKRADDMLTNLNNAQVNGNPTVDYFVKYKDLENYANSIAPSSNLRVLVSVVGKGNLLASFKSPLTNVVANIPVAGLQAALRRQHLGVMKSIVDPELIKQNKQTSWEIYRKTGYQLNNMTDVSPKGMTLGERITQSQGEGAIRKVGRIYENLIYKWSLGAPDLKFKDFAFNDYVSLAATKESGGDVAKANEIYKDAVKILPETELGQRIRQEAIEDSLVSTYQNNGKISESALKIRKSLDFGVGFGEFIAPFVKTPANVVGMGLDTAFGIPRALFNEALRDIKAGKVLPMKSENIRLMVQNGLGVLAAFVISALFDDDDYMPSYSLATNKDKQLAKELNIPFNSIRIGDTWFSMDYLGPLASPLMGWLQQRREEGFINKVMGYVKSGAIQTLSIPAFGNIGDLNEKITNIVRKDGVDALGEVGSDVIEAVVARAVPSIASDIAKAIDENDREASGLWQRIQSKVPLARNRGVVGTSIEGLSEKYNVTTGQAEPRAEYTMIRVLQDLFAGARVKEQVVNDVADELFRLNTEGYGVSLTDITRSGLLSKVSSEKKALIKKDFAKMYSRGVKDLIKTYRYRNANDEDKKDMIDSLRRKYVNELKKKHLKMSKR